MRIQLRPIFSPGTMDSASRPSTPGGIVIRMIGINSSLIPSGEITRSQTSAGGACSSEDSDTRGLVSRRSAKEHLPEQQHVEEDDHSRQDAGQGREPAGVRKGA